MRRRWAQVPRRPVDETGMADPAALTDPAVAAGLIAAVGAIGLTVRSRVVARRPQRTDEDRRLWFTRAAVAATERALFYGDEDTENAIIDLRPPYLRAEIDLTEATTARNAEHEGSEQRDTKNPIDPYPAPENEALAHRNIELDLSNDAEPTIGLDVESNKDALEPPSRPT